MEFLKIFSLFIFIFGNFSSGFQISKKDHNSIIDKQTKALVNAIAQSIVHELFEYHQKDVRSEKPNIFKRNLIRQTKLPAYMNDYLKSQNWDTKAKIHSF